MKFLHSTSTLSYYRSRHARALLSRAISSRIAFHNILAAFPELTSMPQVTIPNSVEAKHHILTNEPPVSEQARRLTPEKLAAAKTIFHQLVEDGICRPSRSP